MSDLEFSIERTQPTQFTGDGHFHAGAAERDITPPFGLPMAGYSLSGKTSRGLWGRLFARALVVEDGQGSRAGLCVCDLMSGTRPLLEIVAARTATSVGISVDRLILSGTHTHNAPGGIYANSLYDTFAQQIDCAGYDRRYVAWLAGEIALTIEQAAGRLERASVAVGTAELWGESKNRSAAAFSWSGWSTTGSGTPADGAEQLGLEDAQTKIDPRVRVLAALRQADAAPLAVFAFFGCHYHATKPESPLYTPDAAGCAVRRARWRLEQRFASSRPVVAVGASCAADVHTMRTDLPDFQRRSRKLARRVGHRLGDRIFEAVDGLPAPGSTGPVSVRFVEPDHSEPSPSGGEATRLSRNWVFGAPVLTGSEETPLDLFDIEEGKTCPDDFIDTHPQHPKCKALDWFQSLIADFLDLEPCPVYPLHQLWIGDILLATIPGEVTTVGAWELEQALLAASSASTVMVVAYAGDYGGYFTTKSQFEHQHYEGASTLYGKNALAYLRDFHSSLVTSGPSPAPGGRIDFETFAADRQFSATPETFPTPDPDPEVVVDLANHRATVEWRMHRDTHLVPATEGRLVVIEERVGGAWQEVSHEGRTLDDYWHAIRIRRKSGGRKWDATLDLPDDLLDRTLRFRIVSRGQFPGAVSDELSIPS